MARPVKATIIFEIGEIEILLNEYAELIQSAILNTPDRIELAALSTVLQSFYTGIESIFTLVAKRVDDDLPTGDSSHIDLLRLMADKTATRPALISEQTAASLKHFLTFRHFARHGYPFRLDWDQMKDHVRQLMPTWQQLKGDLEVFLNAYHE